jgi:putative peptidoglycan lipid II flippase
MAQEISTAALRGGAHSGKRRLDRSSNQTDSQIKMTTLASFANNWKSWRGASLDRSIFAAIITVGGLTLGVKVIAALKETVVARQFGASDNLDAFLIAYLLPMFAINVVSGSFNSSLIPTYIQVQEQEGERAAQQLVSSAMVWSLVLLIALTATMGLGASQILRALGSGFDADKLALTRTLFYILLASLPFSGVFAVWGAVLNAHERFALAAMTPMLTSFAVMTAVFLFGATLGIYAFAIAIIVGSLLEGAILATGLRRHGIPIVPRWHGFSPAMKQVMKQYAPMIAGASIMSGSSLVDQSMAAFLGPGSVSILNYGNKISAVVTGVGATAVSTVVLPHFSRLVAANDWKAAKRTLKSYTSLILLATIPATLILIAFSHTLTGLIFQRGAFTASDTEQVAAVQSMYLLQLPFFVLGRLFVRLTSALKANHILMWGTIISFSLNIALDYLLMKPFGVSGIALSTTIVYAVSLCFMAFMSSRLLRKIEQCD